MYSPVAMRYPMQMAKSKQSKNNNSKNGSSAMVVRAPAATGFKNTRPAPKVAFTRNGNCVVNHSEFVADVYSAVNTPLATGFTINPQEGQTFTWLSALATRFEMYKFRRLKFTYRPSCATTTDGYVILGVDFDFYDTKPSKQELLAWQYSSKSSVWSETKIDVTSGLGKVVPKYCDKSSAPGDLRLSHLGKFWIFTDGIATVRNLGEVYVEYEIELMTPSYKIPPALFASAVTVGTGVNAFNSTTVPTGNLSLPFGGAVNSFIVDTPGQYLIEYSVSGGSWAGSPPSIGFTTPTDAPGSDYSFSPEIIRILQSNGAVCSYYFALFAGKVLITLFQAAMTGSGTHTVKIATSAQL